MGRVKTTYHSEMIIRKLCESEAEFVIFDFSSFFAADVIS